MWWPKMLTIYYFRLLIFSTALRIQKFIRTNFFESLAEQTVTSYHPIDTSCQCGAKNPILKNLKYLIGMLCYYHLDNTGFFLNADIYHLLRIAFTMDNSDFGFSKSFVSFGCSLGEHWPNWPPPSSCLLLTSSSPAVSAVHTHQCRLRIRFTLCNFFT